MEKMILKMGTMEVLPANPPFGEATYSFEHELRYLSAGAFAGSHLVINSGEDMYASSLKIERQVWQRFLLVLGAAKSMVFAIGANASEGIWYQRKASQQDVIPWMEINAYDASRKLEWGSVPNESTQIKGVKIGSIAPGPGMLVIRLTYSGMPKTVW